VTGGGRGVGLLAAYGLARAAAMPAGGLLCDRLVARRVLLLVDVLRAALIGGLAVQVTLRPPPLVTLALFSALAGAGLAGAVLAAVAFGLANAVGELIIVTALQRSFPPASLGHIMGLVMLASAGAFPISVALTTAVVHSAGAAAAFPLAGAFTAAAILYGLSRKAFRSFAAQPGA
jgi:Ca2+/Na+ antiporter